ncbi:hypothetical protein HK098_006968 [Nowakowskiella sp. JEL0407]|nr:hypothetical protein HK098_006968 [Nowakowskiella sp. JEL0407]
MTACSLLVFFLSGAYSKKLKRPEHFEAQCNRVLKPFNMQFDGKQDYNKGVGGLQGNIRFLRKVPKGFQEGFTQFREGYYKRRRSLLSLDTKNKMS